MSKFIYLTDRSRIDTREECERKRFLQYDFDVNGELLGYQRTAASLPLLNGTEIHEAHAKLIAMAAGFEGYTHYSLDLIVEEMRERYTKQATERGVHGHADIEFLISEQSNLLEAMLRTFERTILPALLEEYEVITVEKPMDWEMAPGLVQKLRFDVVMRRRGDGQLVILDWKSMKYASNDWGQLIERSTQTYLYTEAASELFGEPVEMAYVGMVKGAWQKETAKSSPMFGQKIQKSPYLYAYKLTGQDGSVYQTEYTSRKGYVKTRVSDDMPVKKWVDWLFANEPSVVAEMFTFNPPFAPPLADRTRRRELIIREELEHVENIKRYWEMKHEADRTGNEILARTAQDYLDFVAAPMRENSCYKYGQDNACPMVGICFNAGAMENLETDTMYEPRVPHHSTELEEAA